MIIKIEWRQARVELASPLADREKALGFGTNGAERHQNHRSIAQRTLAQAVQHKWKIFRNVSKWGGWKHRLHHLWCNPACNVADCPLEKSARNPSGRDCTWNRSGRDLASR